MCAPSLVGRGTGFPTRSHILSRTGSRARWQALPRAWRTASVALPPRTSIEAPICAAEQRGSGAVVFAAGTLTASADRRCPAPALGAVPDDALPRNSYTAPATASARTPPRTTQLSRVRITFKVTSATRKRVQPAAALQQTGGLLVSVDGRRPAPRCPREKRREKNVHARRDAGGTEHAQVPAAIPVRREKRVRSDHLQRCDSTMKRGTVGLLARPYRVLPRSRGAEDDSGACGFPPLLNPAEGESRLPRLPIQNRNSAFGQFEQI
jgi:hypothetical protein